MLVPTANLTFMLDHSAAQKQAMMGRVQSCGMRHWAANNRPFADYGAFFEIDNLDVAFSVDHVTHSNVEFFSGWLHGHAGRIPARQFYASKQFGGVGIDDFDGSVGSHVSAAPANLHVISGDE